MSGTVAVAGSGRIVVIAVGASSVSGKIRAAVYGEDIEEEGSPLFQKLDKLVREPHRQPSRELCVPRRMAFTLIWHSHSYGLHTWDLARSAVALA